MDLAGTWARIGAWYAQHAPGATFELAPAATEAEIAAFETAVGAQLPADMRASLLIHDGGSTDTWLLGYGELLGLAGMLRQWQMYVDMQRDEGYGQGDNHELAPSLSGPIRPVFWDPKRIPLTDNSGDHLLLDLEPAAGGHPGQIVQHTCDLGPLRVLAPGWASLLERIAADLEAGRYVYSEDDGMAIPAD